jgi:hypothetical protein
VVLVLLEVLLSEELALEMLFPSEASSDCIIP